MQCSDSECQAQLVAFPDGCLSETDYVSGESQRFMVVDRFGYRFYVPESSVTGSFLIDGARLKKELLECEDWLFVERFLEPCSPGYPLGLDGCIDPDESIYGGSFPGFCEVDFHEHWIRIIQNPETDHPFGEVRVSIAFPQSGDVPETVLNVRFCAVAPFVSIFFHEIHPDARIRSLIGGITGSRRLKDALQSISAYVSSMGTGLELERFRVSLNGNKSDALTYLTLNGALDGFSSDLHLIESIEACESAEAYSALLGSLHRDGFISNLRKSLELDLDL
ncbi:hypothetical protein F3I62_19145 [Pseudomonas sp. R-28-1W-6]|uniref:hypothetical protein n=1 Tax=Pseudomonas sp. R-28-1W-6 TaxID=2650101 RepID=UPI001365F468|nr:hypothetical protein [Pseudomonas sp. R-28-1W-6]MWV14223.1 hypothetical protein [Pseudomonas sp. R-28-1W-6]